MKKTTLIVSVAVIAFIGGLSVRGLLSSPLALSNKADQTPLPAFSLPDLSGTEHNINEWQDKVRVINFWATWCPPCLKEMPEFTALQSKYGANGLQFIGIALDDIEPVKEFIESKKINYPILMGVEQGTKIAHDLGNVVNTVPFTVIVDKKGLIVSRHMGELKGDDLSKIINPMVHEK